MVAKSTVAAFAPDAAPGSASARALAILELAANSGRALSLVEISETMKLPKASVHRIVLEMETQGMLLREPGSKRFGVGHRLRSLAVSVMTHSFGHGVRHAIMQRLVDEVGETCNFTMFDGNRVLYIDRVEAQWPLRLHLQPGSRVPLHCTASGKLFLSGLSASVRRRLLTALPLEKHTANTITTVRAMEDALKLIRKQGIGTDNEEFLMGLVAVAVPVMDARRQVCAALAIHGPTARLSLPQALTHVPRLRDAADRLSEALIQESSPALTVG